MENQSCRNGVRVQARILSDVLLDIELSIDIERPRLSALLRGNPPCFKFFFQERRVGLWQAHQFADGSVRQCGPEIEFEMQARQELHEGTIVEFEVPESNGAQRNPQLLFLGEVKALEIDVLDRVRQEFGIRTMRQPIHVLHYAIVEAKYLAA